jgi:hypothetical protein
LNLATIELWESRVPHPSVAYIRKFYPLLAGGLILAGLVNVHSLFDRAVALSAALIGALYASGTRLPLDLRRVAVDGALLCPLVFLL